MLLCAILEAQETRATSFWGLVRDRLWSSSWGRVLVSSVGCVVTWCRQGSRSECCGGRSRTGGVFPVSSWLSRSCCVMLRDRMVVLGAVTFGKTAVLRSWVCNVKCQAGDRGAEPAVWRHNFQFIPSRWRGWWKDIRLYSERGRLLTVLIRTVSPCHEGNVFRQSCELCCNTVMCSICVMISVIV